MDVECEIKRHTNKRENSYKNKTSEEMAWSVLLGTTLLTVALVFLFTLLYVVCDSYLVPCIGLLIKEYKIPEELAAVTFVAFGSAAPELTLNAISAATHSPDLSISAVLGSGMIAFGLLPAVCYFSKDTDDENFIKLLLWPLVREATFYSVALLVFLSIIKDDRISVHESGGLVTIYLFYGCLVTAISIFTPPSKTTLDAAEAVKLQLLLLSIRK